MTTTSRDRLGKSMLAAMVASMVSGLGMVYGGKHVPTERVMRRRTNTHPMITAPDGEIRLWNDTVTTRQVLRARIKPEHYGSLYQGVEALKRS